MEKIAFIGLGNMGLPMAINLQKSGYQITGFDVVDVARQTAESAGIAVSADSNTAVQGCDAAILMLPNGEIALNVANTVLANMPAGSLLIDCSTIDVKTARVIHDEAAKHNKRCLDAPVSGGVVGAENGTLTFMVGGASAAFDAGKPLLDIMGGKAVHCGDGGAGQAAKICNNMLLAVSMIGTCEAFALAEKLGLDQNRLFDVVSTSSGSCWSVNTYCPVPNVGPETPADKNYKPGFAVALMLKDLKLAMEAAKGVDANTHMGEQATQLYNRMSELGCDDDDFSSVIQQLDAL